jgi:hypothetical protein
MALVRYRFPNTSLLRAQEHSPQFVVSRAVIVQFSSRALPSRQPRIDTIQALTPAGRMSAVFFFGPNRLGG